MNLPNFLSKKWRILRIFNISTTKQQKNQSQKNLVCFSINSDGDDVLEIDYIGL